MACNGTTYEVYIRRVADGVVRLHVDHDVGDNYLYEGGEGFNPYQWEDGNYGCDCNRDMFFKRAGGELGPCETDDHPCGESAYRVEKIVVRGGDGTVLYSEV